MEKSKVETLLQREAERQQEIVRKKNEKKLTTAENEQYTYFNKIFTTKCNEIQTLLENSSDLQKNDLPNHFDNITKELNTIKKFMNDSLIFIRGYDVRVCNQRIQDLEVKIHTTEDTLLPKKKFGFKNKKTTKIAHDTVDGAHVETPINFDDFFGFKNINEQNLKLDNLEKKDVTLTNLNNCVIQLPGSPSTLHMSALKNCKIFCGPVSTSIFAENCNDCTFIFACQQLRLHSSVNCIIYLHVTSKAIIEDCKCIKVAPYNYLYPDIDGDFIKSGLDRSVNNWCKLDDFNWLVADKHSPNWSVLDENDKICDWSNVLET